MRRVGRVFAGALCGVLAAVAVAAADTGKAGGVAQVRTQELPVRYRGYARIEPIGTLTVHALLDGTLKDFRVVPGARVRAGEILARIAGPGFASARAAVARARAELKLDRRRLASVRATYPALSSRNELDAARAQVTDARQRLDAAVARLRYLESGAVIRAPRAGTVVETFAVDGEQVAQGAPLLRLQTRGGLWVKGVFYGRAAGALHPGMHGRFEPADGGSPVAVTVRSVLDPLRPDGGRAVGCEPAAKPAEWVNGSAGTLVLEGAPRMVTLVPERALVMDAGRWWVLVERDGGVHRVEVAPGARRDGWVAVRGALHAGEAVVVRDVYRRFHHDFSRHFQNPS